MIIQKYVIIYAQDNTINLIQTCRIHEQQSKETDIGEKSNFISEQDSPFHWTAKFYVYEKKTTYTKREFKYIITDQLMIKKI